MNARQKQRAGRAVAERIAEMAATQTTVARAAGISPRTLRALIAGERWPTDAVQRQIERVLRWRDGEITVRAVQDGSADGVLDALTPTDIGRYLVRRLEERDRLDAHLRRTDARRPR